MAEIPAHWIHEETLGPREVGKVFNVDSRTVTRWASNGVIGFFRTPSGLRRFPTCEVERLLAGRPPEDPQLLIDLAADDQERFHDKWVGGWRRNSMITPKEEQ